MHFSEKYSHMLTLSAKVKEHKICLKKSVHGRGVRHNKGSRAEEGEGAGGLYSLSLESDHTMMILFNYFCPHMCKSIQEQNQFIINQKKKTEPSRTCIAPSVCPTDKHISAANKVTFCLKSK